MKDYASGNIRNVALIGHGGEGKTTLAEAMLFFTGALDRMGRVDDGTAAMDFDPEETKRTISISMAAAPIEYAGHKLNILDCPGYFDFVGEMVQGLKPADAAIIVVGAVSGLNVGAEKAFEACGRNKLPKIALINQMDRENADFTKAYEQLKNKYGTGLAAIKLPIMEGNDFKGFVDLIQNKAYLFDKKTLKETDIPASLKEQAVALREAAIEAAAESDEELMEKFFDGQELTPEEITKGLKTGVSDGGITPVTCAAGAPCLGVGSLMDDIIALLPSPTDAPGAPCKDAKTNQDKTLSCDASAPFAAQVFKTVADPFVGKLSLFKVVSGALQGDTPVYNPRSEKTEKLSTLYVMRGKKQIQVTRLSAGDIGAVAKLNHTITGDTLCDAANPVIFPEIDFPKPCISLAITAKKEGDEDKIFAGLHRLEDEDPTFKVEKNIETLDTLISGLGELHIEVICKKLQNKFNVEAELKDPKIPYRETIRKAVKAEGKHKKQSGGHGQFGHCWIEFEPIHDGSAEFEFIDKIVGGVVPKQYIPAVEKGLRESIQHGVLAGCPVVNIRCTLYDGSYHSVDSSEMAFKTAARLAFKKGCADASPILLEPIYKVMVTIPDEYMGDIIGDLNRRRGRIMGMNPVDGLQEVSAEIPLAEMFKYATDLRSLTQARGSFEMEFERYEEVPAASAQKIIEAVKHDLQDEGNL